MESDSHDDCGILVEGDGMTSDRLLRTCGLCLWAGASIFVVHVILRSVITAGTDPTVVVTDRLWTPINALGVTGAVLVLMGLPAVCVQIADPGRLAGVFGLALLAVAWMFFGLFLSLYSLLLLPWLAEKAPTLVAASAPPPAALLGAFIAGLLAWFAGALLLAVPFIRGRARPSWVGYMLAASAVWMPMGNLVLAPSGPAANLAVNLLSNMGPVLLLIGLGYLGYQTWSGEW
jgi:hypothetical protein